ncbi:MAG TPA: helix-hairpin-helix domain-containing protein, partial [Acidocella sp.]|nr:helix-hairpin-helix domain-containing protein [Acidocella sp.]
TIEDLAMTPLDELASIEGFDETVAAELQRRAEASLAREATELEEKRIALGVSDEVAAIEALSAKDLIALGEKGVKSLDDLADLAGDELVEIVGADALSEEAANEIIMAARAHWFADDAAGGDGNAA